MDYRLITSEVLYSSLFQGFKILFDICLPIVLPIVVGGIIIAIFKKLATTFTFNFALASGSTKREAKKKARCVGDIVDVVSAISDLSNLNKKE